MEIKFYLRLLVYSSIFLMLTSCKSPGSTFEGYILNSHDGKVEVIKGITLDEFKKIDTLPNGNEDTMYERYLLNYDSKDLKKGQKVKVWLPTGNVRTSNPIKAKAEKIQILN
nr:DUF3221 domain-containing protein [Metabacillus kandeliae]